MKIVICGSIKFLDDMRKVKEEMTALGHHVEIPDMVDQKYGVEDVDIKIKYDLIRNYYKAIKDADSVLIFNKDKNGIRGYVGGNTFLEMGFAHVLNKDLYVLNPLPKKMTYYQEMLTMQPIILDGNYMRMFN